MIWVIISKLTIVTPCIHCASFNMIIILFQWCHFKYMKNVYETCSNVYETYWTVNNFLLKFTDKNTKIQKKNQAHITKFEKKWPSVCLLRILALVSLLWHTWDWEEDNKRVKITSFTQYCLSFTTSLHRWSTFAFSFMILLHAL